MWRACASYPSTSSTEYCGRADSTPGCATRSASMSSRSRFRCSASKRTSSARLRALVRAPTSVGHSTQVRTVTGVDLDARPGLEEQRDLDLGAGLERGRL